MKRYVWLFFSIVGYAGLAQGKGEAFELVKSDDSIFIYERWIIFPKTNPPQEAREVKGVFTVRAPIAKCLRLIQNEQQIGKWQSHVSEFRVHLQPDTLVWYEYSYHDIPWPVSDQDHFLQYKQSWLAPDKLFVAFESKVDGKLAPVRKSVMRMELSGSWLFERLPAGRTRATYRIISKPANIPRFLTDPIIRGNMMSTIKAYIALLEKR